MKLVTFVHQDVDEPSVGVVLKERILDLTAAGREAGSDCMDSMLHLIEAGQEGRRIAAALIEAADKPGFPHLIRRETATVKAPIPRPGKIIGVGLNYAEHVTESSRSLETEKELPERPVLFDKPSTAVVGPGDYIEHDSSLTSELDWEAELAVVIGRTARRVAREDAYDHVFGYTIINDVSARDQRRSGQWFFSKGQDSYAPMGPVLVTADEVDDPLNLRIQLRVNSTTKQDSNTRHMLFTIPELIEDITSGVTLEPGDIIASGSPSGVGAGRTPPEYLAPGDVVEAEIEGIGVLCNAVIDTTRVPVET